MPKRQCIRHTDREAGGGRDFIAAVSEPSFDRVCAGRVGCQEAFVSSTEAGEVNGVCVRGAIAWVRCDSRGHSCVGAQLDKDW